MQHYGGIAGPYAPLYPEVASKLLAEVPSYAGRWIYMVLVTFFEVDEEWGDDPEWIKGIIRATKVQVMDKSGVGGRGFGGFQKAWDQLIASSLVDQRPDKTLELPFFKKKRYQAISPRAVDERLLRLEEMHKADLEEAMTRSETETPLRGDLRGKKLSTPLRGEKTPLRGGKTPLRGVDNSSDLPSGSPKTERPARSGAESSLKGLKKEKISLSMRNVISGFYRGIGQQRISREKRERANKIFKKLRQDGFSAEDIAFAVDWTLENAKEEPYDFSIIQHTIGQAIAARQKEEADAKQIEERETAAAEERDRREREEKEAERIEAYKESLGPEERENLREEALAEIRESGEYKEQFINDILIRVKENEILQRKSSQENEADNEGEP